MCLYGSGSSASQSWQSQKPGARPLGDSTVVQSEGSVLLDDTRTKQTNQIDKAELTGSFPPRLRSGLHAPPAVKASFSGPALQVDPSDQGPSVWIFEDKEAEKQGIADQLGCKVQRVMDTFRLTNQSVLDETCTLLQQMRPNLIWCSLFRSGTHRGNRRDKLAMRALRRVSVAGVYAILLSGG